MSRPVAIELKDVHKKFVYKKEAPQSLKSLLISICTGEYFKLKAETKDVLSGVSLKVYEGETVGIMGRNGVGKSTLMRLLCGVYKPTQGEIKVSGRIAPMIALGAGFHQDLTGYENIFLNGAIIGIPRAELLELAPKIIEFSELGNEIHKPVKYYSSGMLMRLGFSVASHIDAPILVLDEVLSVGDKGFQEKCIRKVRELFESGRTIVLVTHDPIQVLDLCTRCVVIEKGKVVYDGDVQSGTQRYMDLFV